MMNKEELDKIYNKIWNDILNGRELIIPKEYDINYFNLPNKFTLLHQSCELSNLNAVKSILKHTPDLNIETAHGHTCLGCLHPLYKKSFPIFKEIINAGIKLSYKLLYNDFPYVLYSKNNKKFNISHKYKELGETRFKIWVNMSYDDK